MSRNSAIPAPLSKKSENALPRPAAAGLRVGVRNDSAEREARHISDRVVSGGRAPRGWSLSGFGIGAPSEALPAPPIVHEVLKSPGRPLDPGNRDFAEPRFGRGFGHIRIHSDARAAESADAVNARAYTVGSQIVLGREYSPGSAAGNKLIAHELVHTLQQEGSANATLQRDPKAGADSKLIDDFEAKFAGAAKLIKGNADAMKLVKEAADAGAKFGGYVEDSAGKNLGRPFTSGSTVYVPKSHADPPLAMSDFLFELNNAVRQPQFAAIEGAAAKGKKSDTAAAKKYAHDKVDLEVEGMLRMGEIWFKTKSGFGQKAGDFDKYDGEFFLSEYQSFKDKKKTKEEIVKDVSQRIYTTGDIKGKTIEQFYSEQYKDLAK